MFGSALIGHKSNSETRVHCLGLNLAPARNHSIPHTLSARRTEAHEHTHIHTHKWWWWWWCGEGGAAATAADGETILATLKHGSHTRLRELKPVRHQSKDRVESSHDVKREGTSISVPCIITVFIQ